MPEVSVVVPVYNVAPYLRKCIDSILAQTTRDYELILVNDGSTDESPKILEEYAMLLPHIKLVHKQNGGLSDARNEGMKHAVGKYISFIDSDDFIEPEMLEKCLAKLHQTDADIVIFDYYQYYQETDKKEVMKNSFSGDHTYSLKENPELLTGIANAAWNKIYRRSLFTNNNISYPKGFLYEDLGTTYRLLARAEKVAFVNKPLYDYLKDRPGNITGAFNQRAYNVLDMVRITLEDYKNLGIYDTYYEELKYLGSINILECLKKTRTCTDYPMVKDYVDACYGFIKENWPEFPKGKYPVKREKYDWVYTNKNILNLYLKYLNVKRKGKHA